MKGFDKKGQRGVLILSKREALDSNVCINRKRGLFFVKEPYRLHNR